MGLFSKLKNVLFEEEEVEIPVITKKTEEEPKNLREQRYNPPSFDTEEIDVSPSRDNISRFRNVKRDIEIDVSNDDVKTQEIPISMEKEEEENKSPFLSFDEDEFERVNAKIKENEEKQIKQEKHEKQEKEKQNPKRKEEPRRTEAPKRFKPSPVISPVYGILDKNYKKEDIVAKNEVIPTFEEVSVETVRKKAFGTLVDDIESSLGEENVVIKEEQQDDRSIDEILTDSIDEMISLDEEIEIPIMSSDNSSVEDLLEESVEEEREEEKDDSQEIEKSNLENEEPILENNEIELPTFEDLNEEDEREKKEDSLLEKTDTIKMLDDIEDELDDFKTNKELLEDTTETDLFNLIDSMYENREEDK